MVKHFCINPVCCCRAMLLLMDATLMRGDDARRIQLCDMFYKLVEQTRPHTGFAFGTVTDQGKVNRVRGACLSLL